jgi:hypothetical protein
MVMGSTMEDKGMPKGWLYNWEGMATMGKQNPETRFCRRLACCLSMCVLALSNRCSKGSSCAHKGLVTNWPHHSTLHPQSSFILVMTTTFLVICMELALKLLLPGLLQTEGLGKEFRSSNEADSQTKVSDSY